MDTSKEKDVLDKIHFINLEMLKELDRVCRENGLHYFLFAGTLLGAVRHQDFIPWDDDVDVMMLRQDLDRLILLREQFREDFRLWIPEEQNYFYDAVTRLLYEPGQLRQPGEEELFYHNDTNKISLDIFALDHACTGNGYKRQIFFLKAAYGLLMGHRYRLVWGKYKGIQKLQVAVLSSIGKKIPVKRLYALYNRIARKANGKDTEYVFNSTNQLRVMHHVFPKRDFESESYMYLHDAQFPVPADAHEVLSINFKGDYMKLTGKRRRKPGHARLEEVEIYYEGEKL